MDDTHHLPVELLEQVSEGDTLILPPLFGTVTDEPVNLYVKEILRANGTTRISGLATYFGITIRKMMLHVDTETGAIKNAS